MLYLKLFYCYSRPLKDFLISQGFRFILHSIHDKTQKKYWVFEGNDELNKQLEVWKLRK